MLAALLNEMWSAGAACRLQGAAREYAAQHRISGMVLKAVDYTRETEVKENGPAKEFAEDFPNHARGHLREGLGGL
jgi:hypothetical protein